MSIALPRDLPGDAAGEPVAGAPAAARPSYLTAERGLRSWLTTTDHKRIGLLFLGAMVVMLALGGTFALLLRIQLLKPAGAIVDFSAYNRLFTLHGITMVWLFLIPSIPAALGNFVLPIMLGAKDVAFPRLNLASFYVYLAGAAIMLAGMWLGGLDTGWTFYVPYSSGSSPFFVAPTLIGIFVVGVSSILTGLNFIVTTHTLRARGMGWGRLPLFVWAIYGTSFIQVLATPVLGMVLTLVGLDRVFDFGLFDPARGGDPVLFQHLFWFYSHPAVYIMILPAMGVVSEVVCTFSQKNPSSYKAIAVSTLGIAFVGFLAWGHHMFVAGMSRLDAGVFGLLSMLVAIFSAIKVFTWVGTMHRGAISLRAPLLYVFAFLFFFIFGGMTGVALATVALDVHWTDTYFVVAHFHFIMVGGAIAAFLAGLHYWFPLMTGKLYAERPAAIAAGLVFVGFSGTFIPQFLLGNGGMPRRYASYPAHFQALHVASTIGSWVLASGMLLALVTLVHGVLRGRAAPRNPWNSMSYEWLAEVPPPPHNFDETPGMPLGPYDYDRREVPS